MPSISSPGRRTLIGCGFASDSPANHRSDKSTSQRAAARSLPALQLGGVSAPQTPIKTRCSVQARRAPRKAARHASWRALDLRLALRSTLGRYGAAGLGRHRECACVVLCATVALAARFARRARCRSSFFRLRVARFAGQRPAAPPSLSKKPSPSPPARAAARAD